MNTTLTSLTLAVGQRAPLAVVEAGDRLQDVPGGEGEPGVTLEPGLAPVGHVTGLHSEPIINLRHGAAVDLLTGGDVGLRPLSSQLTLSPDLRDTCGKHLAQGAGELYQGAEGGLQAGSFGAEAGLQGGTVGGVEGGEAVTLLCSVTQELDQHPPGVGGQGEGGGDLVSEPGPGVELQTLHASVVNLK